jgi:hypothetical protein
MMAARELPTYIVSAGGQRHLPDYLMGFLDIAAV